MRSRVNQELGGTVQRPPTSNLQFPPPGRFLAFLSNEADAEKLDVYVRPFDPNHPEAPGPGPATQVSNNGAIGMVFWRQDGKEMYS